MVSGWSLQVGILLAEIIADHAVDHEGAVDFAGSGEDLAAGQIAPLVGADDAAGLDPLVVRVQVGGEVAARRVFGAHLFRLGDDVDDLLAEGIHAVEVGAHAFEHDFVADVDHVGVAHAAAIDDVGHLHARLQLVLLHSDGEDADVAGLHVVGDFAGQAGERASRDFFQHERFEWGPDLGQLLYDAGGDLAVGRVGDDGDFLARAGCAGKC